MFWPTHAVARMVGTHWPGCSGSRYLVALPDTRMCERRRAPAPRSGDALDCRRQSGAEERGFAESDGALRDAMARGAQELRCSCRLVWPVDRPCDSRRPPRGTVLDMDLSVSPTQGEQETGTAITPALFTGSNWPLQSVCARVGRSRYRFAGPA